jgi:PAS domain S-box-containing protein
LKERGSIPAVSATLGGDRRWVARMAAVAELGRAALSGLDADALVDEALRLVANVLEGAQVGVLEPMGETEDLRVRAGVGWQAPIAGTTVPGATGSLAGFTLLEDEPVLVTDLASETRFSVPPVVAEHAAASAVSAVMRGPQGPVGVMCVFSPVPGKFSDEDVAFLRIVANTLAAALGRAAVDHEVRRTGALLQEVVGGATDAIFVKDLEGRFLLINDAGAAVLGRPREEIVGLRTEDVFPPAVAAGIKEGEAAVMARGDWLTYEDHVVTGAGEARTFLSTKGPYRDPDGNVIGLVGISRDITERKRVEDRQRLLAASGRLLATELDETGTLAEVVALPLLGRVFGPG